MAGEALYYGTGRRKNAVARVRLVPGTGKVTINGREGVEYFGREALLDYAKTPFKVTDTQDHFDVIARINGGGISGQAGALRHGIARRGAGKAPVVAQPLAVRRLGRDGARHARERFSGAPDAPGVRAPPAGHGQGAGVALALCAQGGSVGFGHEDPSRNGLQYRNFSHPARELCGDKKKCLTPARNARILLVL